MCKNIHGGLIQNAVNSEVTRKYNSILNQGHTNMLCTVCGLPGTNQRQKGISINDI